MDYPQEPRDVAGAEGKRCQADFLETIVFVRDGGRWLIDRWLIDRWLIDRYHAAALHRWSCVG